MPKTTRTYRILQAGVLAFRQQSISARAEFCLITNQRGRWGFPKGNIAQSETAADAALKEAYEEAGLRGDLLGESFASYDYGKNKRQFRVQMFLMHVTSADNEWPEHSQRDRIWASITNAYRLINRVSLHKILDRAPAHIRELTSAIKAI